MRGDKVLCAADSTELKNFGGLTAGLTNWPAGYCTGLLLARRLLKQVGLADVYKPNENRDGAFFNVEDDMDDEKRPFKAMLDVGLAPTTTSARVFAVLKGACDGGVNVPHKTKRFSGFKRSCVEEIKGKRGKVTDTEKTEAPIDLCDDSVPVGELRRGAVGRDGVRWPGWWRRAVTTDEACEGTK